MAIVTVTLYVPCYTKYFEHIIKSFNNHYQIDLTQFQGSTEEETAEDSGVVRLEIQSISEKESIISDHSRRHDEDKLTSSTSRGKLKLNN